MNRFNVREKIVESCFLDPRGLIDPNIRALRKWFGGSIYTGAAVPSNQAIRRGTTRRIWDLVPVPVIAGVP